MAGLGKEGTRKWQGELYRVWTGLRPFRDKSNNTVRALRDPRILDPNGSRLNITGSTPNFIRQFLHTRRAATYLHEPELDVVASATDMYQDSMIGIVTENPAMGDPVLSASGSAQLMEVILNDTYLRTHQGEEDTDAITNCILFGMGVKVHGYQSQVVYDPVTDAAEYEYGLTRIDNGHAHVYRRGPHGVGVTGPAPDGHFHRVLGDVVRESKDGHYHELFAPENDQILIDRVIGEFKKLPAKFDTDATFYWNEKCIPNLPWGKSIDPWMFMMDSEANRITDARWAAFARWWSVQEIREDPQLRNVAVDISDESVKFAQEHSELMSYDKRILEGGVWTGTEESADDKDAMSNKVLVWTVFIRKDPVLPNGRLNDTVVMLTDAVDYPLYVSPLYPYLDVEDRPYLPFALLVWNNAVAGEQPSSDIESWQPIAEDRLRIRAAINAQAEVEGQNKSLIDSTLGSDNLVRKINNASAGSYVPVPGLSTIMRETGGKGPVLQLKPNPISQDLYAYLDRLKQEMREESGENEMGRGQPLPSKRTATEVHGLMQQRQVGLDCMYQSIGDFVGRSAWIYGNILQQRYAGRGMQVYATDPRTGKDVAVSFRRAMLKRWFRYTMRSHSTTPQMKETMRQQRLQLGTQFTQVLQMLRDMWPMIGQQVNPMGMLEMWKSILSDWDIPGVSKIFMPAPPGTIVNPASGPGTSGGGGGPGPRPSPYSDQNTAGAYAATAQGAPGQLANALGQMEQG